MAMDLLHSSLVNLKIERSVECLLNDMISTIEHWSYENMLRHNKLEVLVAHRKNEELIKKIDVIEGEKKKLMESIDSLHSKAAVVRENFVLEISQILFDSRHSHKLKQKLKDLELKASLVDTLQKQLMDAEDTINAFKNDNSRDNNKARIEASGIVEESHANNTTTNSDSDNTTTSQCVQSNTPPIDSSANQGAELIPVTISQFHDTAESSTAESLVAHEKKSKESTPKHCNFLAELDDELLLQVFSFLSTIEVLSSAEVNKYVFKRVVTLFGIDSQVVKEDWGVKNKSNSSNNSKIVSSAITNNPAQSSSVAVRTNDSITNPVQSIAQSAQLTIANVLGALATVTNNRNSLSENNPMVKTVSSLNDSSNSSNTNILTQEMAEAFSKKLTPAELKIIITMSEKLKKQTVALDETNVSREDMKARLTNAESIRDFLVEKLKNAELAIKSSMIEVATFKKQALADQEVISFLDLRCQELDTLNRDLSKRIDRLQASYDLTTITYAKKEKQSLQELSEYKTKCDDYDTNFKSQKKVLVKEVKSLRAQLEAVTTERNRYKLQLTTLRDALFVSDNNMAAPSPQMPKTDISKNAYNIRQSKSLF